MSQVLGQYGELVWRHFPESREMVKSLVDDELQAAIDEERQPEFVSVFEYSVHAVNPVIKDLEKAAPSVDLAQRFSQFCRALLTYSGADAREVGYNFDVTILEYADAPNTVAAMRAVDPELVELVRERYSRWK